MMIFEIAAIAILILIIWYKDKSWGQIYLPGPIAWPLLGNILQIDQARPHITLDKWRHRYGDNYQFRLFTSNVVVLGSYDAIYEALVQKRQDFAGRPKLFRFDFLSEGYQDLAFDSPNPKWTTLRKSLTRYMKMYDSGLHRLETITNEVLKDLVTDISELGSTPFNPRIHIYNTVANIMFVLMVGKKFAIDTEEFQLFKNAENLGITVSGPVGEGAELDIFPWLRHFRRSVMSRLQAFTNHKVLLHNLLQQHVYDEKANEASRNGLIKHMEAHQQELGEERIRNGLMEMLIAGTSTTTITFTILLNILLQNQEIQRKVQQEIDDVVGTDRQPELGDRGKMPYSRAAIYEVLRYSSILPIGLPHCTTKDTQIGDVNIPKDTQVLMFLWSLHTREDFWDEPFTFRPDRFLDAEGNLLQADHPNRKHLLPFGAGSRVCIGEVMAGNRLFLMLTNILQHFNVERNPDEDFVTYDPRTYTFGLAAQPLPFTLRMVPRK